jgi:WbqC-like protein family
LTANDMTTVVISQPMLFPWPGFFELLSQADIYIHLDDAQFSRGSFTNRVQVKHPSGIKWMTIPIKKEGMLQRICDLQADGVDWKRVHRALILQALRSASHIDTAVELMDCVYAHEQIIALLTASIEQLSRTIMLERPSRWLKASEMNVSGRSSNRVLALVRSVGGTRYVTAHGGSNYLDHEAFERAGVTVEYVDYSKTPYTQLHGPFCPFVSALDVVANLGPAAHTILHPKTIPWRAFLGQKRTHRRDVRSWIGSPNM